MSRKKKKQLTEKNMKDITIVIGIMIVIILAVILFVDAKKTNSLLTKDDYTLSAKINEETRNKVELKIELDEEKKKDVEYSFDGGKTWQKDNKYIINEGESIEIKIKDKNGNIITEEYKADKEGPIITIDLPSQIEQNTTINILDYVTAKDKSGLKGKVEVTPITLDTTTLGKKQITFIATDNLNNETTITIEIEVVPKKTTENNNDNNKDNDSNNGDDTKDDNSSSTNQKKTYYRYRTKTIKNYACDYYDCSYTDNNDTTTPTLIFANNSYCCTGDNCTKKNPQINFPCPTGYYCPAVMTDQYKVYEDTCYNSRYIRVEAKTYTKTECDSDEIKIGSYCHKIESTGTYPEGCTTSDCVVFPSTSPCSGKVPNEMINTPCPIGMACVAVMTERYKAEGNVCYDKRYITVTQKAGEKTICDSDEISINGYCHKIDSKGTYTCPTDYTLINSTTCAKKVEKTCNKVCTSETWSKWSDWTTTPIIETETTEVETKEM